ncbi:Serine carboxypeptidase 3 [Marasmius tenuissimus]|nr:Serine carboxypeptidase 3 [Marasmius tenuissimus]
MLRLLHTRPIVPRSLVHLHQCRVAGNAPRRLKSTQTSRTSKKDFPHNKSSTQPEPKAHQPTWLATKIQTSPTTKFWFDKLVTVLGYNTDKQISGRRTLILYQDLCVSAPDANREFWQNECDLPPTFQSWFTVANLHIWILTVRLRALPDPHGKHYVQSLVDHFFLDIEDRIRAILQPSIPPIPPYTSFTSFYVNPNIPADGKLKRGSRAPERLVTRQMKIFKEQWMGMGMSFDLGLVQGDAELAAAVWRNLMGARGARGIAYSDSDSSTPAFRRSVNLVGGSVVNPEKVDFEKEERSDDGSGVHDYLPDQVDKYVRYPELMLELVTYIRRELARLESISDEDIMEGYVSAAMKFGGLNRLKK